MTKRFIVAAFAIGLSLTTLLADEDVRAVQTKLKDGGFYFGEVNGERSSDLSAAITRYQIRNGLEITGNLNPETSKALGVKATAGAGQSPTSPDSETWRHLRKTQPVRAATDTQHEPPPATEPAVRGNSRTARTSPLIPSSSGDDATMLLKPDRLRDYVAAFVLAGLDPQVGAELEFFADRVRYYDEGVVGREKIRRDLQRYDAQWPHRRFWLAGELDAKPEAGRLRVSFPLRYELQNGSKRRSGKVEKRLLLEPTGDDLQIVGVNEAKAR